MAATDLRGRDGAGSSSRGATAVAAACGVLAVVAAVGSVVLFVLNGLAAADLASDDTGGLVAWTSFALVGSVVAAKRPRNAVGWLLLLIGIGQLVSIFGQQYGEYGLVTDPGSLPAVRLVTGAYLLHVPAFAALPLTLLLFPTGRPPTRRWYALVCWLVVSAAAMTFGLAWLLLEHDPTALFTDDVALHELESPPHVELLGTIGYFGTLLAIFPVGVAFLLRFRRSHGVERQQLKWFAFAVVALLATLPLGELGIAGWAAGIVSVAMLPVAIGVAVVRYRLYDIDRIVRRTVTYALVVTVLVAVYALGVVGLGGAIRAAAGASHDLVVAASTLAAAALFRPVRRRVQSAVDRRFNRSQSDGRVAVEAFSQRMRDELDLDALSVEVRRTAARTVQPTHASLWSPSTGQTSP